MLRFTLALTFRLTFAFVLRFTLVRALPLTFRAASAMGAPTVSMASAATRWSRTVRDMLGLLLPAAGGRRGLGQANALGIRRRIEREGGVVHRRGEVPGVDRRRLRPRGVGHRR